MLTDNGNKYFVLGTNVILYDYRCIYSFDEYSVIIPITYQKGRVPDRTFPGGQARPPHPLGRLQPGEKVRKGTGHPHLHGYKTPTQGEGIRAEGYETGKVKSIDGLYKGKHVIEGVDETLVDDFYRDGFVSLSNRDIGYLPGGIKSKVEPCMQPLHDNLSVIQHQYSESLVEYAEPHPPP